MVFRKHELWGVFFLSGLQFALGSSLDSGNSGRCLAMRKPNIVLILADDMGCGDIGAFNFGTSQTPVLDSLLEDGAWLTQHYAGSAVCAPSRAALLTGRYPQRTGTIDTQVDYGLRDMAARERTIADLLRQNGYATGHIGKWHLGWRNPGCRPLNRGFDEAISLETTHHWDWVINRNGKREESDGRYLADVLNDEAVGFIHRHQNEPFFLYLAHFAPHTPLLAPEQDIEPFRRQGLSEELSTLYGMIRCMDRGIGRVLDELDRVGLRENTLVIFSSDNGPQFATSWTDRYRIERYNFGFRGHKDLVCEGGIRVPAIIRWPAGLKVHGAIHDVTHFCDWLPTLLAAAGMALPKDNLPLDGRSLLPLLRGEQAELPERRFWQFSRYYPTAYHNAAVRDGDWKLVRPVMGDGVDGPVLGILKPRGIVEPPHQFIEDTPYIPQLPPGLPAQLFNLRTDPQELHDLAAQYPDRVERMEQMLDDWFYAVMTDYTETEMEVRK
jgi:arylsulfatase A